MVEGLLVAETEGLVATVTVDVALPVHPFTSVPITV